MCARGRNSKCHTAPAQIIFVSNPSPPSSMLLSMSRSISPSLFSPSFPHFLSPIPWLYHKKNNPLPKRYLQTILCLVLHSLLPSLEKNQSPIRWYLQTILCHASFSTPSSSPSPLSHLLYISFPLLSLPPSLSPIPL